jgi:hypothetical protein
MFPLVGEIIARAYWKPKIEAGRQLPHYTTAFSAAGALRRRPRQTRKWRQSSAQEYLWCHSLIRNFTETSECSLLCISMEGNRLFPYHVFGPVVVGRPIMIGRDYFIRQAETLLELARAAGDPKVAAFLTERAGDLKALVEELGAAPDPSHGAPDIKSLCGQIT